MGGGNTEALKRMQPTQLLYKRNASFGLWHQSYDYMRSLQWHWSSSALRCFLWYAVFKCAVRRGAWMMQSYAVKFMRRLYLWVTLHWLPEKCDVILCSHGSVDTSWQSYGSVNKHVIILILVMQSTIYYNCSNSSQSHWFGHNSNSLTCYTQAAVLQVCIRLQTGCRFCKNNTLSNSPNVNKSSSTWKYHNGEQVLMHSGELVLRLVHAFYLFGSVLAAIWSASTFWPWATSGGKLVWLWMRPLFYTDKTRRNMCVFVYQPLAKVKRLVLFHMTRKNLIKFSGFIFQRLRPVRKNNTSGVRKKRKLLQDCF